MLTETSAGVSLGPFVDYKSSWFASAMNAEMTELFELGNAGSTVSKSYEASVQVALKHGVRITYCGSIDDQLVSMEVGCMRSFNIVHNC